MGRRIKVWDSGTLTVATATTFDGNADGCDFNSDKSEAYSKAPHGLIDGYIEKIVVNFTASDTSANLTIASRDTPSENFLALATHNWATTDVTVYPRVALVDSSNTALDLSDGQGGDTAVYGYYVSSGSVKVTIADATADDTVQIKIYYR